MYSVAHPRRPSAIAAAKKAAVCSDGGLVSPANKGAVGTPLSWLARRVSFGWGSLRAAAAAAVVTSVMIIVTGGAVRVTGSGLGCPSRASCTGEGLAPTPEMGIHGAIEFGLRMLTVVLCVAVGALNIISRCQREPDRAVLRAVWLQFWIIVLDALVGGVTVLARLSPYVVVAHFIAAMLLLTAAVYTFELAGWGGGGSTATSIPDPALTVRARWLVAAAGVLAVISTAVTGSGVHSGDSSEVHRMPLGLSRVPGESCMEGCCK